MSGDRPRPSPAAAADSVRRAPGEASTYRHPANSAMESAGGQCPRGGMHIWKFGKCTKCGRGEGDEVASKLLVDRGCPHGGRHTFKFARCTKCGAAEGVATKPMSTYARSPTYVHGQTSTAVAPPTLQRAGSSVEELVSEIAQLHMSLPTQDEVLSTFRAFDKDGSGTLTVDELVGVLTNPSTGLAMSMAEATRFINEFDVNHDGQLDLEEWSAAIGLPTSTRQRPSPPSRPEPIAQSRLRTHAGALGAPPSARQTATARCPSGDGDACRQGGDCTFAFGRCTKCGQRENWTRANPATARVRNAGSFRRPI